MSTFLELEHMLNAAKLMGLLGLGWVLLVSGGAGLQGQSYPEENEPRKS